jgi:hypothetical protein
MPSMMKVPTSSRVVRLANIESYLPEIAAAQMGGSSSPDALPARNRLKFWLSEDISSDTLPASVILFSAPPEQSTAWLGGRWHKGAAAPDPPAFHRTCRLPELCPCQAADRHRAWTHPQLAQIHAGHCVIPVHRESRNCARESPWTWDNRTCEFQLSPSSVDSNS